MPTFRFQGLAYRGHDPSWAFAPTSGEGAAIHGGRFNPIGVPALYLSLAVETVFKEASAGFVHRFDPLTVCAYEVDCDGLVDLSSGWRRGQPRGDGCALVARSDGRTAAGLLGDPRSVARG